MSYSSEKLLNQNNFSQYQYTHHEKQLNHPHDHYNEQLHFKWSDSR